MVFLVFYGLQKELTSNIPMNKICFVILSHSSYSDVWELLLKSYKDKVLSGLADVDFFITSDSTLNEYENSLLQDNGFRHLIYTKNIPWSNALMQVVRKNELSNYSHIFFSFDDLIVINFSVVKFKNATSEMFLNSDKYLKIYNSSHVNLWAKMFNLFEKHKLFEIRKHDSYRGNLVFACWDVHYLRKVLNNQGLNNLSPWQFEQRVNSFIDDAIGYKCVFSNVLEYENVIIKGKVDKLALLKSNKSNKCDFVTNREFMTRRESVIHSVKLRVFQSARQILPHRLFASLRNVKSRFLG